MIHRLPIFELPFCSQRRLGFHDLAVLVHDWRLEEPLRGRVLDLMEEMNYQANILANDIKKYMYLYIHTNQIINIYQYNIYIYVHVLITYLVCRALHTWMLKRTDHPKKMIGLEMLPNLWSQAAWATCGYIFG